MNIKRLEVMVSSGAVTVDIVTELGSVYLRLTAPSATDTLVDTEDLTSIANILVQSMRDCAWILSKQDTTMADDVSSQELPSTE